MNTEATENNSTRVTGVIDFHGLTLWVMKHGSTDYLYLKPLSDLVGLNWRTTKTTIFEEENVTLYGIKRLKHPDFAAGGGASTPPSQAEGVYIRLDRARMFLARVNTRQMKAQGNVEAAEALLALQVEWAEALHQYETHGIAIKRSLKDERTQLIGLIKARTATSHAGERQALTRMIHDSMAELGFPVEEPQQELGL